jgi:hypothetical protein
MANPSSPATSESVEALLPAGSAVRTVTVKVKIGRNPGGKGPAVAPERVAEEVARCLRQLRENYFHLTGDELSWEFPFWARSLNG